MKAMQNFMHLSLVVAIILASMGFRVSTAHCSDEKGSSISLFSDPSCCCGKAAKDLSESCPDMSCIVQGSFAASAIFNSTTRQVIQLVKEPITYPNFAETICPVLLERTPNFVLPPPVSGRYIGILHQTFII